VFNTHRMVEEYMRTCYAPSAERFAELTRDNLKFAADLSIWRRKLMREWSLVHVDRIDISRISRADYEVVSFLKGTRPELYKKLRTQATEAGRATTRTVTAAAKRAAPVARHA